VREVGWRVRIGDPRRANLRQMAISWPVVNNGSRAMLAASRSLPECNRTDGSGG
jgi:hypothetical protein